MILQLHHANLLAYIVNVIVTYGVGAGLFGADLPDNATLSAKYQTLVTPIGWAFAIWGLIFLMQAVWVVLPFVRSSPLVDIVGYDYVYVVAAQVGWTITFSLELIAASALCMLTIFYFLRKMVLALRETGSESAGSYLLYQFPFTLHSGWITAASLVNINLLLVAYSFDATLQWYTALLSLFVLLVVAAAELRYDWTIPLVLMWAAFGISKELEAPKDLISHTFSDRQISWIQQGSRTVCIAVGALILLRVVADLARNYKSRTGAGSPEAAPLRN